jgi:hypothetical protein
VAGESSAGQRRLVWADRTGATVPIELPANAGTTLYNDVRLSPDGSRLALAVGSSGRADIWIHHLERGTLTRLTFTGSNATPVWSADGRDIFYISIAGTRSTLLRTRADGGSEPAELTTFEWRSYLKHISRDGTWGVIDRAGQKTDVFRFTLPGEADPTPLVATRFDEYATVVSPDARWIAYQSDESSQPEIYVRPADGGGGRWQVSNAGGEEPMWSPGGRHPRRGALVRRTAADHRRAGAVGSERTVGASRHAAMMAQFDRGGRRRRILLRETFATSALEERRCRRRLPDPARGHG